MPLGFPLSKVKKFLFFLLSEGGQEAVFLLFFLPRSREGNSGLHSTLFNYSSFCGMIQKVYSNHLQ